MGGGGVAILVRNYIDATEVDLDTDDICAITTTIDGKKTCIISCYWGFAHGGIPNLDTLTDLLSHHKHTIVMGDFNAYHPTWGHQQANERGLRISICTYRTTTTNQPSITTQQTAIQH